MHRAARLLTSMVLLGSFVHPAPASGQSWSTEFGAPPTGEGLNGTGWVLHVYQDKLVVGGSFTQAGPVSTNHVAAWDGTQWTALGSGIACDRVRGLTEYNGELIAAGQCGSDGFLMKWNGSLWSSLIPPGAVKPFYAVHEHAGLLFANTREGSASKLSWWDGNSWSSVDLPTATSPGTPVIFGMTVLQDQLYLAGGLGALAFPAAGFLYSWDGSEFHGPGYAFDSDRWCLQQHDNMLYVGGKWSASGGPSGPDGSIAIWDGSSWVPLGTELYVYDVFAMETYHGRLIVADCCRVTSFAGTTEIPLNSGEVSVFATKAFQDDLYVAGSFTSVGASVPSYNIAKWSEPVTGVEDTPVAARGLRVDSAPNPFNPSVTLSIYVPAKAEVVVTICDATGRVVRHLANGVRDAGTHQIVWNGTADSGSRMASGVYFARVVAGNDAVTRKLVLLK